MSVCNNLVSHFRPRTGKIEYIIIHCSRSTPKKQIRIMEENGVSAHYIIGRNGSLSEVIKLTDVAYHAGLSSWYHSQGNSLNENSIGIELECPSMGQSRRAYTYAQINCLIELLQKLQQKYHITNDHILAHSDIAPQRKPDPGVYFPWKKLHQSGLTFWYDERRLHPLHDETTLLQTIGYNTENIYAARYAFCRRWLRKEVKIQSDISYLLDHPFEPNFMPQNQEKYLKRLRAVAFMAEKIRFISSTSQKKHTL